MEAEDFVKLFKKEKEIYFKDCFSKKNKSETTRLISEINLSTKQKIVFKQALDSAFTDIFYTILLGLDGCTSIGNEQISYNLKDENGNQISGDIESHAYEYFHGDKKDLIL